MDENFQNSYSLSRTLISNLPYLLLWITCYRPRRERKDAYNKFMANIPNETMSYFEYSKTACGIVDDLLEYFILIGKPLDLHTRIVGAMYMYNIFTESNIDGEV